MRETREHAGLKEEAACHENLPGESAENEIDSVIFTLRDIVNSLREARDYYLATEGFSEELADAISEIENLIENSSVAEECRSLDVVDRALDGED